MESTDPDQSSTDQVNLVTSNFTVVTLYLIICFTTAFENADPTSATDTDQPLTYQAVLSPFESLIANNFVTYNILVLIHQHINAASIRGIIYDK